MASLVVAKGIGHCREPLVEADEGFAALRLRQMQCIASSRLDCRNPRDRDQIGGRGMAEAIWISSV